MAHHSGLLLLVVALLSLSACGADSDTLNKGGSIRAPGVLVSGGGGVAKLQVQSDGNLVVVQTTAADKVLWASGTDGHSGVHLELQGDGNLVLYSDSPHVLWLQHGQCPKACHAERLQPCALYGPEYRAVGIKHAVCA